MTIERIPLSISDVEAVGRLVSYGMADAYYDGTYLVVANADLVEKINALISQEEWRSQDLVTIKAGYKAAIDEAAELTRLQYITPGVGQALTYMQKADEARRYLSASNPVDSDYPLLAAEVGITAENIVRVAAVVAAAYSQWLKIGAAIEAVRLDGKAAIDAAGSENDAKAAFDAVAWPEAKVAGQAE
ncbi:MULTISPECIES: hypothetical protein [Agrobacterium]|uniref:hypothetical protein n=1 Tax=Agrobacterium TaxID=357 RepID=UPI0009BA2F49|nr:MULTISPECIES: hypothetical protein [Agrobacterium]QCL72190.1 hypothetical protein CFBP5499_01195 [Agrobacterium tumefaciens]